VRRDQGGHALGADDGAEQAHDLLAGFLVELAGGLVGQQQLWPAGERAGDGDALLLAAGELARPLPGVIGQAHERQHQGHPLLALAPRDPRDPQRYADVLRRGQHREQPERLEDIGHGLPAQSHSRPLAHGRHLLPGDVHAAAVG
jgi:hypothetical protein